MFSPQQESTESSNTTIEDEDVKGTMKPEAGRPSADSVLGEEVFVSADTCRS